MSNENLQTIKKVNWRGTVFTLPEPIEIDLDYYKKLEALIKEIIN